MKEMLSTHFDERTVPVDMLVMHSSVYPRDKTLGYFDEYKVSCHYLMDFNGDLIKCVDEKNRAWHSAPGFWRGSDESINNRSIGIEILHESLGQDPYREVQIEKLIHFCAKIIKKYNIDPKNVVGHSDVDPKRKADPGLAFPWKRLAREGIGLWYQPRNADKVKENDVGKLLASIGYDTRDDEAIIASSYAFRRRFLPEEVIRDDDILHLVDNVYPISDKGLIGGEKFLKTLKAVYYSYNK